MKRTASSAIKGPRRCVCGRCVACLENARWERIFQEKFGQQERDYYAAAPREPRSAGVSSKAFADASIYACTEEVEPRKVETPDRNLERLFEFVRRVHFGDKVA